MLINSIHNLEANEMDYVYEVDIELMNAMFKAYRQIKENLYGK